MGEATEEKLGVTPVAKTGAKPKVKDDAETFRNARTWVDEHVMPIFAWFGIVGLAVLGADTLLNHLDLRVRLIASIFSVAFLAFKLR